MRGGGDHQHDALAGLEPTVAVDDERRLEFPAATRVGLSDYLAGTHEIRAGTATVTLTADDVPTLPSTSVAVAVSATAPFGTVEVSQLNVNGAAVTVPMSVVEFRKNLTLAMATESVAVAVIATVPVTDPAGGAVKVTTGGAFSVGGAPRSMRP